MPASLENSAVATGLEKVSFHSKRRAMQKNVQTTIQLYSSHMLARLCSKSFKPRQCSKKQRHHFADKGPHNQAMVFPVVMYERESWTIQKVECQEYMLSNCAPG